MSSKRQKARNRVSEEELVKNVIWPGVDAHQSSATTKYFIVSGKGFHLAGLKVNV